eukprot:769133-Alexandrium_andersonii.AAC.1
MSASLVGSEMCIRDRRHTIPGSLQPKLRAFDCPATELLVWVLPAHRIPCLLYTSDAADDM